MSANYVSNKKMFCPDVGSGKILKTEAQLSRVLKGEENFTSWTLWYIIGEDVCSCSFLCI